MPPIRRAADATARITLTHKEPGDEESADHEEDIDADKTAGKDAGPQVIGDHLGHSESAQAAEPG